MLPEPLCFHGRPASDLRKSGSCAYWREQNPTHPRSPRSVMAGNRNAVDRNTRATTVPLLREVHHGKSRKKLAVARDQVLVKLDSALTVKVNGEKLSVVQQLCDSVAEIEVGHFLATHFRIHPNISG